MMTSLNEKKKMIRCYVTKLVYVVPRNKTKIKIKQQQHDNNNVYQLSCSIC